MVSASGSFTISQLERETYQAKRGVSKDVGGEKTQAAKKRRKENLEEAAQENEVNCSLTIVFKDEAAKEEYLAFLEMRPYTCFVKAEVFDGIIRSVYPKKPKQARKCA